jgi:hypothetical protein
MPFPIVELPEVHFSEGAVELILPVASAILICPFCRRDNVILDFCNATNFTKFIDKNVATIDQASLPKEYFPLPLTLV